MDECGYWHSCKDKKTGICINGAFTHCPTYKIKKESQNSEDSVLGVGAVSEETAKGLTSVINDPVTKKPRPVGVIRKILNNMFKEDMSDY